VQILRCLVVVLAALLLCAPAVAIAQTQTVPGAGSGVSTQPPVELGGSPPPPPGQVPPPPAPASSAAGGELPNTGTDPRLLFLVGLAMTLLGVGLRLRTADADLY
jgi:LPXTG-motif cell wall-anchored protein